jgi:neutral amino acid transport system ATP-binding protein
LDSETGDDVALLDVRNVSRHFGGVAALAGATLDVSRGSITALIGPNGAGKTTLFHVVTGFHRPERGEIRFAGERINGMPPHAVAKRGLVRTFQITKALSRMSVLENMMLAAPDQPGEQVWRLVATPRAVRRREREIEEKAWALLDRVRLAELGRDYAGTLSGGQRKLLEFARALMCEPTMVMLDEPMAGVNPALGRQLLEHMRELRDERRLTFLLIEHDMDVVMTVSERVIVMNEGNVIADGTPDAVRGDPRVVDAYLGADAGDPTTAGVDATGAAQ